MRAIALAALALSGVFATARAQTHLVIVSGVGGDAERRERFYTLGRSLMDAATERLGMSASNVVFLAERVDRDADRIRARSTKAEVLRVLDELAERAGPFDRVAIVLIGHGSSRGDEAHFNVPGPDLSATDFAKALDRFPTQQIAFVNTTSASGDFIGALSGERRTILTATKSGFERNETQFGKFFVDAFATDVADTDKDERVSMLEAFTYANREVARLYETEGQLQTEHAQLDDNGDGEGTGEPGANASDGSLARTFFLHTLSEPTGAVASSDPVLEGLYATKEKLELQIAELRNLKDSMDPADYEAELERLLVELARTGQAIRAREKEPQS